MQITIRTILGAAFPLDVTPAETMLEFRHDIAKAVQLALDQFYLTYDQETLSDDNTIDDYGIQDKAVVFCVQRPASSRTVDARVEGAESLTVGFRLTDTVQKLKRIISERAFGRRCPLKMLFNGLPLEDSKTLNECGLGQHAAVSVKRV